MGKNEQCSVSVVFGLYVSHEQTEFIHINSLKVVGAISTAKWGGVKIRDVLRECGLDVDALALGELEIDGLNHVQFESYDQDETGVHYGGSVPRLESYGWIG